MPPVLEATLLRATCAHIILIDELFFLNDLLSEIFYFTCRRSAERPSPILYVNVPI